MNLLYHAYYPRESEKELVRVHINIEEDHLSLFQPLSTLTFCINIVKICCILLLQIKLIDDVGIIKFSNVVKHVSIEETIAISNLSLEEVKN
ncbi:hypothetical protein RCL_jg2269.t1 [Rhizophagus clarus]|uniref:Uncharacterized protein n=1 Tax=Rhizophagus clarus TaxID=94130 RepID=A0A8H3QBK7_9GLOM|nr:hypothetical protein RCL_jg2269.t1 [Rhizophagus clarus]